MIKSEHSLADFVIPHITIEPSKLNKELHYDNPMYNFLLIADEGWMIYNDEHFKEYDEKLSVKGMHGYHSDNLNMHGIFYAYGPKFKKNMSIDTFELIHIYPIICDILDIEPYSEIDGKLEILKSIVK